MAEGLGGALFHRKGFDMPTADTKRQRSRKAIKPTASAQIEPSESAELDRICTVTGRSRSYVVRAAIIYILSQNAAGAIDWSVNAEQW